MRVLPHYKEDAGVRCSLSISLAQNLDSLSQEDAQIISIYMESCVVIDEWLSNIRDPISGRLDIPSKTWCDGQYVWNSSHIHYVKKYRVRLPDEFVEHVKSRVKMKFDAKSLSKAELHAEFEEILSKLAAGDESFYATYEV